MHLYPDRGAFSTNSTGTVTQGTNQATSKYKLTAVDAIAPVLPCSAGVLAHVLLHRLPVLNDDTFYNPHPRPTFGDATPRTNICTTLPYVFKAFADDIRLLADEEGCDVIIDDVTYTAS